MPERRRTALRGGCAEAHRRTSSSRALPGGCVPQTSVSGSYARMRTGVGRHPKTATTSRHGPSTGARAPSVADALVALGLGRALFWRPRGAVARRVECMSLRVHDSTQQGCGQTGAAFLTPRVRISHRTRQNPRGAGPGSARSRLWRIVRQLRIHRTPPGHLVADLPRPPRGFRGCKWARRVAPRGTRFRAAVSIPIDTPRPRRPQPTTIGLFLRDSA